jgi:transcription initiation factor TFIIH subunit 2
MAKKFIYDYYDQNPISQLGLLVTRNRLAERITDLSGNLSSHVNKLQKLMNTAGLASLQNSIILATSLLQHVPSYGQRELLIGIFTHLLYSY